MQAKIEIEGIETLIKQLKKMPEKMKRSYLLKILRSGSKPVVDAAKHEVAQIMEKAYSEGRYPTGNLYNSIGWITGKSEEYPNIQVGAKVQGAPGGYWNKRSYSGGRRRSGSRFKGFHAHLVHYGTMNRRTRKGFGRGAAKGIPFMENAFEKSRTQVTANLTKSVSKYVEKIARETIVPKY